MIETLSLPPDQAGISNAAQMLRAGQLVAFPTETVYGLGADARSDIAVANIYKAKGRPSFNPLIVHVASLEAATKFVDFPPEFMRLAKIFWPGALTLVAPVKQNSGISDLVTAGLPSLAVRVPTHPLAIRLLEVFSGPIAAPSANPSGQISPTTTAHVLDGLSGKIAAVLDGGACEVGLESTIIGIAGENSDIVLLRPGGLSKSVIEDAIGNKIDASPAEKIVAPGQLTSHYAPISNLRMNVDNPSANEAYLAFGNGLELSNCLDLSPSRDLDEAASNLFAHLRKLDVLACQKRLQGIAVAKVPSVGLGLAINDRLNRASAPRS